MKRPRRNHSAAFKAKVALALAKIIARLMRLLTRQGMLIEEQGVRYLAGIEADQALTPLQAASCTYRIALGPRAGQKVLSLQAVSGRGEPCPPALCANAHGFSLHAALRCNAHERNELELSRTAQISPVVAIELSPLVQESVRFFGAHQAGLQFLFEPVGIAADV